MLNCPWNLPSNLNWTASTNDLLCLLKELFVLFLQREITAGHCMQTKQASETQPLHSRLHSATLFPHIRQWWSHFKTVKCTSSVSLSHFTSMSLLSLSWPTILWWNRPQTDDSSLTGNAEKKFLLNNLWPKRKLYVGKWIIRTGFNEGVSERVKVQGVFYDDVTTWRATHACGTACEPSWQTGSLSPTWCGAENLDWKEGSRHGKNGDD